MSSRTWDSTNGSSLLLIAGPSGVGKSSTAFALHSVLSTLEIRHAVIEGDNLDLAYPAPWEHDFALRNLTAMWGNYLKLGYRRLIYSNTVSALNATAIATAMADQPKVITAILTATAETVRGRLEQRERGADLDLHLERARVAAVNLAQNAPANAHWIATDLLAPHEVAGQLLTISGWQS